MKREGEAGHFEGGRGRPAWVDALIRALADDRQVTEIGQKMIHAVLIAEKEVKRAIRIRHKMKPVFELSRHTEYATVLDYRYCFFLILLHDVNYMCHLLIKKQLGCHYKTLVI